MDLIDREALLRKLYRDEKCMNTRFLNCVRFALTIDAQPVKHARWLQRKRNGYAVLVCSDCEKEKEGYTRTAFCPNCGARMDAEDTNVLAKDGGDENGTI